MKAIKMIGLAALVALTAMAFVGGSSASAMKTVLCDNDAGAQHVIPCSEATHVHEESVGKEELLTSLGTTKCNLLALSDVVLVLPLMLNTTYTYTNCELGGSSCTATEENGPAEITIEKTGHETSKVTGAGLVHLVCSGFIDCSFNSTGLEGTDKGPLLSTQENGEITISEKTVTKETGGFLCPKTAKLDLTTTPLPGSPRYVRLMECVNQVNGLWKEQGTGGECKGDDVNRQSSWELFWS